jgi:uncharacterized protein (DUF362 family)
MKRLLRRRDVWPASVLAAGAASVALSGEPEVERPGGESPVAIVRASSYSVELVRPMLDGIRACGLDVRGRNVLLKPNLVEFDRSTAINTDAAVLAAAYEAFRALGAASVRIGEGPGHRRDTFELVREAGYDRAVGRFESVFTDLNRDDVSEVRGFADDSSIFLPDTALAADLIVSLPKLKTHHWAGVTLAMKNLFGLVPGAVYGWPKNRLHYVGITRSILELNRVFRNTFAIVDGIVGMEGNGPIQGTPKHAGVLVFGADLRAVDATCCRIMGLEPMKVEYLRDAVHLGAISTGRIAQRGERVEPVSVEFGVLEQFKELRANTTNSTVRLSRNMPLLGGRLNGTKDIPHAYCSNQAAYETNRKII